MSVVIQRANAHHLAEIARIERENFSDPWSVGLLERKLHDPRIRFYVAVQDRVLGYAILLILPPEGELLNIAVDQGHQGRGLGRELLSALMDEANEEGVESIHLEVRAANLSAISLYRALGFEMRGLRKNYYENPKEDGILMIHPLKESCL